MPSATSVASGGIRSPRHHFCRRRPPTCSGKRNSASDQIVTAYAFTRCSPVELKAISAVEFDTITDDFDHDVACKGLLRRYVNRRNGLPFLSPYQLSSLESPGAVHRLPLRSRCSAVEVVSEHDGRIGTDRLSWHAKVPMPAAQDASNTAFPTSALTELSSTVSFVLLPRFISSRRTGSWTGSRGLRCPIQRTFRPSSARPRTRTLVDLNWSIRIIQEKERKVI